MMHVPVVHEEVADLKLEEGVTWVGRKDSRRQSGPCSYILGERLLEEND
jgi:hypothetical protein